MTEGAVRMAISDKSLQAIPGSKPVAVGFNEAKPWLLGRRGFIAWPDRVVEDRFLARAIQDAETPEVLGRLIHQVTDFQAPEKLAEKIGWTADEIKAWFDGNFVFDLERARNLARVLELDVPMFVGKALEVSERAEGGRS